MIDFSNVTDIMLGQSQVTQIADSLGNVLWTSTPAPVVTGYFYVEDTSGSDNTLTITKNNDNAPTIEVFKSTDQQNWTSMGSTSTTALTATVPANGKLYLKANTNSWGLSTGFNKVECTGNFKIGGHIMSLIAGDNFDNATLQYDYSFRNLFASTTITDAGGVILPTNTTNSCYLAMFYGCTSLTTAPAALPATSLSGDCYNGMFHDCAILTTAPAALPATTLADKCYYEMFAGCKLLSSAPALSATTMASKCCYRMFRGCYALTTAPALPVTTLANNCYEDMFANCTSLTAAPVLPATTMADYSYKTMFSGCTALTTAPALPATTLALQCYYQMFKGCTSLTTAPVLPATTLVSQCYYQMFQNCTNLNSVTSYATAVTVAQLNGWLGNVAATGDFYNLGGATYVRNASGIPASWTEHKPNYFYVEDTSGSDNTLTIAKNDNVAPTIEVFYSTDQQNWTSMGNPSTVGTTATIPANGKLYLKCTADRWAGSYFNHITASGTHNVGGNIMSLLYGDNYDGQTAFTYESALAYLFQYDTNLQSAANLQMPAMTLTRYCYQQTFRGCTSLTTAPVLPATTLAQNAYSEMFKGCSSLNSVTTYADDISASYCLYDWMSGVAATGDFYNLGTATYPSGADGIPSGWTEHTSL